MTIAFCVAAAAMGLVVGWLIRLMVERRPRPPELDADRMTVAELLEAVVQSAPGGVMVVDRFRDVLVFNRLAEEYSLVRDQLVDERVWQASKRTLDTGRPATADFVSRRASDRSEVAVRCSVQLISGPALPGGPVERYAVVYADDDTDTQRLEATRRDFVANVSHELKTPVGAIGLLSEALLESVDDPEAVAHFGTRVLTESTRMGNMVNELIALSRLQGAERLPDLGVVDIDDVVGEAVARAQTTAEANRITLLVDEPSGLEVRGDDTLLLTALSNLISNAIAYSPQNTTVSISRRERTVSGRSTVEIAVTDRGIGIAAEDQERVFERFFRVDKARSRMTGGTGLGLAIVKHVAANHGGSIKLWSKPGTGSTFTIVLPAAAGPTDPNPTETHPSHNEEVLR